VVGGQGILTRTGESPAQPARRPQPQTDGSQPLGRRLLAQPEQAAARRRARRPRPQTGGIGRVTAIRRARRVPGGSRVTAIRRARRRYTGRGGIFTRAGEPAGCGAGPGG